MGTYDVTLPASQPIVFPSRCVVCEAKNPDSHIKLSFLGITTTPIMTQVSDDIIYGVGAIDPKYYGGNTSNKIEGIPACKKCSGGLKRYHFGLKFGYYTGWLPGVGLIFLHVPIIVSMPVVVLGAMSAGIYTILRPPSFGASFMNGVANFEFKSKLVAEEFLALNSEAKYKEKTKTATTATVPPPSVVDAPQTTPAVGDTPDKAGPTA